VNVGLFDSRIYADTRSPRADLPVLLARHLAARGHEPATEIMGHPERWYHNSDRCSRERVLLAGEAAGIEPWLGEGISAALAYGPIAAETILRALATNDFSFSDYHQRLLTHRLGRFLRRNRLIARIFYDHRLQNALPLFGRILQGYMRLKHGRNRKNV
jgi:flavin-dependent dehydrogenase